MKPESQNIEPKPVKQPYEEPKLEAREKLVEVTEVSSVTVLPA